MKQTREPQTPHLVVIRISDSTAMKELRKKVLETAAMQPSFPGADTLAQLGTLPIEEPDEVGAKHFSRPGFRAGLLRLPGTRTRVLMALGSATKVNFGVDDNAFCVLLTETLAEEPVEGLWVADFARLLRSIDYLSDTWKAVRTSCRYVHHAGSVIDTQGLTAEIQFLFEALSAAAEARAVVKRTTIGRMRAYVDSKFPFGEKSAPLGYVKDKDGRLRLDPTPPTAVVRTIVQVLGDPNLTNQQRVERVGEAGGASTIRSQQERRKVRVDQLSNPGTAVARWYRLLDLWQTGRYDLDFELPPLLHNTQITLPVEIDDRPEGRVWRLSFDLGVPDGGWACKDEFRAAVRARNQRSDHLTFSGGVANGRSRKPFSGLPAWTENGTQYALLSRSGSKYDLRARPDAEAHVQRTIGKETRWVSTGWGRRPNLAGRSVGNLRADVLHTAVAEGLIDAATEGLPLKDTSRALIESSDELAHQLTYELEQAELRAENAQRNANEATNTAVRRSHLHDHELAVVELERIRQDLLRFAMPEDGHTLSVDANRIAEVLASLAGVPGSLPAEAADALRVLLQGFRLVPVDDRTACWEASLRIPFAGGTLVLGPATGTVTLERDGDHHRARRESSLAYRAGEAARLFMAHGRDLPQIGDALGVITLDRVAQTIRGYLKDEFGLPRPAALALVAYGKPSARAAVWARLHDRPASSDLSRAYAKHTADAYLAGPLRDDQSARRLRLAKAEAVFAQLQAAGGWVTDAEVPQLRATVGVNERTMDNYVRGFERHGKTNPPLLQRQEGGIGFIRCEHPGCDGWGTVLAMLPEVPTEVLCASCLRMPSLEQPAHVYPDDYR